MSGFPRDEERLSAYLDGELDAAEAAELEARLAEDPALAAELDAVYEVIVALRGLDAVEPPPGFEDRLQARVSAEAPPAPVVPLPRRRPWIAIGSAAAAMVFAGIVGGVALLQGAGGELGPVDATRTPAAAARGLEAAAGDPGTVFLGDESDARAYFARMVDAPVGAVAPSTDLGRCAEDVAPGGEPVVAHAEPVVYEGRERFAYVVLHRAGGPDRPEALLVDPATCEVTAAIGL